MWKAHLRVTIALLLLIVVTLPASARRPPPKKHHEPDKVWASPSTTTRPTGSLPVAEGAPIVATYFFYWYDYPSKSHIWNPNGSDALLYHPVRFDGTFSYKNDHWYLSEFENMVEAGIDIVLPVYWGHGRYPECEPWSQKGLEHIVLVLNHMAEKGQDHPMVGMFYDTTTLQYNPGSGFPEVNRANLTTDYGRETFFLTVKSFFDTIPQDFRATIDGKPIVWLYNAIFAKEFDENFFDAFRAMFSAEYGVEPYIVAERSWTGAGEADAWYGWGAALNGSDVGRGVVGVGPGYDDSTIPGRKPTIVDRIDGLLYEWGWLTALQVEPRIVVIETWNELHEGTQICETRELGMKYIELTRFFADTLKFPEQLRNSEVELLLDLYFNTITLEPAEVWQIDLERGYVEFPIRIAAKKRNIFGHLQWNDAGTGIAIYPPEDDFILNKGDTLRL